MVILSRRRVFCYNEFTEYYNVGDKFNENQEIPWISKQKSQGISNLQTLQTNLSKRRLLEKKIQSYGESSHVYGQ
jgi:hypothetical protein